MAKKFIDLDGVEHIWSKIKSNFLSLTGNQTVAGAKTFTDTIHATHSITDVKTVPSANEYQTALVLRDEKNQAFGHLQTASYADTESVLVKLSIIDGVRNGQTDNGALVTHAIGIGMDKDGKHFTQAPTPSAGDDSNQIATTKWVNDETVHKAGTETITGAKTFNAATTFGNTVNLNASVQGGAGRDIWIAHASGGTQHRSVILAGNAYADGASLYLHAKDQANAGRFDLVAHDGTNSKILCGKPDGTLTWNGKNVMLEGAGGSAYKIPYATCSTATDTAAKVATITNDVGFSLVAGACVVVKFANQILPGEQSGRGNRTLNVNSTGAKNIHVDSGAFSSGNYPIKYAQARTMLFVYDGTQYQLIRSSST